MSRRAKALASCTILLLAGCGDDRSEPEPEPEPEPETFSHDNELSAFATCGPDDGPVLLLIEDQTCTVTFEPEQGLYVWIDLLDGFDEGELFEVGDDSFESCQRCSDGVCEDAISCAVELLDGSETELLVRLEASFPSGPLSRELSAYLCVSGCAW